ncbi:MAG: CPBP family intramembrane glutamic endopeptidase [Caldicoprobacterales bacterium]|jgi:membrane protease YdiL (CAAX protease family)|nr:CPBP family intramembrane metalloprotease [Clostridiales bacterium]
MPDISFILLLLLNGLITIAFLVLAVIYFFIEGRESTRKAAKKTLFISLLVFGLNFVNALMIRYWVEFPKTGGYDLNSNSSLATNLFTAGISIITTILYLRNGQSFSERNKMPGSILLEAHPKPFKWNLKLIFLPIPFLVIWTFLWFAIFTPEPTDLAIASTPEANSLRAYIYTFFTASVIAPLSEEILYRHFAIGLLGRWFGRSKPAIMLNIGITSLIFAIAHIGVVTSDWIKIIQILPAGILFGWIYYKKGLEHSVLSHSMFNTLVIPVAVLLEKIAV